MLAKHFSKHREIFCTSDTPLTEVFQKMMEQNCDCMPIVESPTHKNIIGTITEHDICLKTISEGLNPQKVTAGRVMNGNFKTIDGDATVEQCAECLRSNDSEKLFVIDENLAFAGILTASDIQTEKPHVHLKTVITDLNSVLQTMQTAH